MDAQIMDKILFASLRAGRENEITVTGVSMEPNLYAGDKVTVKRFAEYEVGDVLVFTYKGELLIHRLLKIENGRYFCKGDNALRLEDMPYEDIGGKVVLCNGDPISDPPEWLCGLSYLVSREFRRQGYDIEKTKKSGIYRFYNKLIKKAEDNTMIYRKNTDMDYIPTDETSLAVFDPESGDTHFFNETALDILNCLCEPCDLETLLDRLCDIYEATPDMIRADVEDFLAGGIEKKVVLVE